MIAFSDLSAFALADPAATAIPDAPSPVPAAPVCPAVERLESRDGIDYAFVLGSAHPVTASLYIELYTPKQEYDLELPAVDVKTESALRGSAFRSAALDLHDPGNDPFLGASVEALPVGAAAPCPAVVLAIPSVADVRMRPEPASSPSPEEAAIVSEFTANEGIAAPLLRVLTKGYSCGTPFASARIATIVSPRYPSYLSASGTSLVRVDLDDRDRVVRTSLFKSSGYAAFDNEALSAAAASSYRSAVVACKRVSGSYLFHAQFKHG